MKIVEIKIEPITYISILKFTIEKEVNEHFKIW